MSGPARIQLGVDQAAYDSTGERRPRGSAIPFFETDDVTGMREGVHGRGGTPSEIEKVNWIKMRMLQVADPDGHVLWFDQSFQMPDTGKDPLRQLEKALPMMPLSDVAAGVAYYHRCWASRSRMLTVTSESWTATT